MSKERRPYGPWYPPNGPPPILADPVCAHPHHTPQGHTVTRATENDALSLFGQSDPDGGDGYVPGAWDEVRAAYLDGHISEAAYVTLRAALRVIPPGMGTK